MARENLERYYYGKLYGGEVEIGGIELGALHPKQRNAMQQIQFQLPRQEITPRQETITRQALIPRQELTMRQQIIPRQAMIPKQIVIPRQEIIPKQAVIPKQKIIPRQEIIPRQGIVPRTITYPEITIPHLVGFNLHDTGIGKIIQKPKKKKEAYKYKPSILGVYRGMKTFKAPKFLSGLEARGILVKKRRKR